MLMHTVLFKPRPDLPDDDRRALESALMSALSGIPAIRSFRLGRRVKHGALYEGSMREDLEFAAFVEFDDLDSLKAYLQHPAHQELGSRFMAATAAGLIYDYQVVDGTDLRGVLEGSRVRPSGGRGS